MWAGATPLVRQTTLRPILRPGASSLAKVWLPSAVNPAAIAGAVVVLMAVMALVIVVGLTFGPVASSGLIAGVLAAIFAMQRTANRDMVSAPQWTILGRAIDGQGFQLLEDIDGRFAYAEQHVKRLPTGISWPEVAEDVRALLWEAAEHGAELTALDAEIHELRYAEPGTPQAALKHSLEDQRKAHWDLMRAIQWEAETLARTAGNAVAASKVALARTGSLAALRRITPSRRAIVAAGALAEARLRLELLASVWAELDETGTLAAERLDAERRKALGDGSP